MRSRARFAIQFLQVVGVALIAALLITTVSTRVVSKFLHEEDVAMNQFDDVLSSTAETNSHIWFTTANRKSITTTTRSLRAFLARNDAARGLETRQTILVTICEDRNCMLACSINQWVCIRSNDRIKSLAIASAHTDLFYVSPMVLFKKDPYPCFEPFMLSHDVISTSSSNNLDDLMSSNVIWLKTGSMKLVSSLRVVQHIQNRGANLLNKVFSGDKTTLVTKDGEDLSKNLEPSNGLSLHLLEPKRFLRHQDAQKVISEAAIDSVFIDLACGDDTPHRNYLAMTEGYWEDLDRYYSNPPPMISIDSMEGSSTELIWQLQLMLTLARYSHRSFLPPAHTKLISTSNSSADILIHATFPIPHISRAVEVEILEPTYLENVRQHRQGTPSNSTETAKENNIGSGFRSSDTVFNLDVRNHLTLSSLLGELLSPALQGLSIIKIVHLDSALPKIVDFQIPIFLSKLSLCDQRLTMTCRNMCRYSNKHLRTVGEWPPLLALTAGTKIPTPPTVVSFQDDLQFV